MTGDAMMASSEIDQQLTASVQPQTNGEMGLEEGIQEKLLASGPEGASSKHDQSLGVGLSAKESEEQESLTNVSIQKDSIVSAPSDLIPIETDTQDEDDEEVEDAEHDLSPNNDVPENEVQAFAKAENIVQEQDIILSPIVNQEIGTSGVISVQRKDGTIATARLKEDSDYLSENARNEASPSKMSQEQDDGSGYENGGKVTTISHLTVETEGTSLPASLTVMSPTVSGGLKTQRRQTQNLAAIFGAGSSVSFSLFIYFYLPFSALMAMMLCGTTTSLFLYTVYRQLLVEYNNLMNTGLLQYIPEILRNELTQTTLHELLMRQGNTENPHKYLMLYFIPGLTPEQRTALVDRLPEKKRELLRRHGLGYFLGDRFMEMLIGRNNLSQRELAAAPVASQTSTRSLIPQEVAEDTKSKAGDENSDIGLVGAEDSMVIEDRSAEVPAQNTRSRSLAGFGESNDSPEGNKDEEDGEEDASESNAVMQVIREAVAEMVEAYSSSAITNALETAERVTDVAANYLVRAGAVQAGSALGFGLLSMMYVERRPVPSALVRFRGNFANRGAIASWMSTGIISGLGVAATSLLARSIARRAAEARRKTLQLSKKTNNNDAKSN